MTRSFLSKRVKRTGQSISHYEGFLIISIAAFFLFLLDVIPAYANAISESGKWFGSEVFAAIQFWGFVGFVAFVPKNTIVLGCVLTLGGAFLPEFSSVKKSNHGTGTVSVEIQQAGKIHLRGAPRYAVLVVGILIVLWLLWQGVSEFSKLK